MLSRKLTKALVVRTPPVRQTPVRQTPQEPVVEVQPEVQPEPEVQTEPEVQPEVQEIQPEVQEIQPEPEIQTEPEVQPEDQPEPEVQPEIQPEPEAGLSVESLLAKIASEVSAEVSSGAWDSQVDDLIAWEKAHKNRKGILSLLESRKAAPSA
jgi:hypothetical protein